MKRLAIAMAVAALFVSCSPKQIEFATREGLMSPTGKLSAEFLLSKDGTPMYSLNYGETQIVLPSALGFELRGDLKATEMVYNADGSIDKVDAHPCEPFNSGFEVLSVNRSDFDETWEPVWGEESQIRNNYNELEVNLKHSATDRLMTLRFRLYDDGLGFRYEFPGQQPLNYFVIKEELTEFNMAGDYHAWWIPGDYDTQEYEYGQTRISEISAHFKEQVCGNSSQTFFSTSGVQTSLQMKTDEGLYVNIHEAALVDYPCMHLLADCKKHSFRSWLTPDAQGWKGRLQTPCHTPWRTVQVAASGAEQLSSRLILNLNEPCALDDVSWIHPTKYMGVWWAMIAGANEWSYTHEFNSVKLGETDFATAKPHNNHGANSDNVYYYMDFAARNGFDALLVEGWNIGWEDWANCNKDYVFDFQTPYPDFDIAGLNAAAHARGMKLIMHHETSSSVRNYERHMEDAYNLMEKYGYDAVKSGYVGDILPWGEYHYGQWMNNHYLYAVKQAAKHHIMVNAHEATRPTGLCRTYPNLIGNESARGTEYQAFGGTQPYHVTVLPFTRLNGGPMDFTPGIFEPDLKKWAGSSYVNATLANQLGLYLTMYSPLQMAADTPFNYEKFMDAFQFIKDVAIDWSESRYLDAEIGDYVIVARKAKKDGRWFCGGVTDENAREFDIKLDFLEDGRSYDATIYVDAPDADYKTNPQAYTITKQTVTSADTIHVRMAPGGGFAISF